MRIEQLASASGGRAAFPREIEDLFPLYNQIHRDLGSGYHITYTPECPGDGKLRRIEVRVRGEALRVYQSRDSYYSKPVRCRGGTSTAGTLTPGHPR